MKAISTRALRFRDPAAEALTDNFVASDDPEWQVLETGASWEDSNAVMFTKTPSTDSRFSGGIKKLSKKAVKLIRLPSKDRLPLLKVQDKECNYACLNDSLENPPGENEETDGFNFWSQQPAEETQEKPKRVKSLKKLLKLKRGKSLVDDKEDDQNPILQNIPSSFAGPVFDSLDAHGGFDSESEAASSNFRPPSYIQMEDPRINKLNQMCAEEPHKIDGVIKILQMYDELDEILMMPQKSNKTKMSFSTENLKVPNVNTSVERSDEVLFDQDPFQGVSGAQLEEKESRKVADESRVEEDEVSSPNFCGSFDWCNFNSLKDSDTVNAYCVTPDFEQVKQKLVVPDFGEVKEKLFSWSKNPASGTPDTQNANSSATSDETVVTGPVQSSPSRDVSRPVIVSVGINTSVDKEDDDHTSAFGGSKMVIQETYFHVPVVSDDDDDQFFVDSDRSGESANEEIVADLIAAKRDNIHLLEGDNITTQHGLESIMEESSRYAHSETIFMDDEDEIIKHHPIDEDLEEEEQLNELGLGLI